MPDWTANAERYLAEHYAETIDDQEPDMEPSLEQAMRDLAGDLRRYLADDEAFVARRVAAIEALVKEIAERLARRRLMADELGRLAEQGERR